MLAKIKHRNARIIWIFFEGTKESLGVTANHPLFSHDRNGWVAAGRFRIDERVRTATGKAAKIRGIRKVQKSHVVYNMEVHRGKNYFVGEVGVLAHNTGLKCPKEAMDDVFKNCDGDCAAKLKSLIDKIGKGKLFRFGPGKGGSEAADDFWKNVKMDDGKFYPPGWSEHVGVLLPDGTVLDPLFNKSFPSIDSFVKEYASNRLITGLLKALKE